MQSPDAGSAPALAWPPMRLSDLRQAYREGTTTPTEVICEVLARLDRRRNDGVWISRLPSQAIADRAAELTALRDRPGVLDRLPLFGVPFAVKDNLAVAGLPTTAGCPAFGRVAGRTAPVVLRLIGQGAILVGTTNLDQFATGLVGVRTPYGVPANVFGRGLIPGGSSSGSAVAVAAGLVAFALGTDTAGSGRVPAAMNGIAGVKPTRGLVSTAGLVPACRSLDCVSVFAADLADAATVAGLAAGPDPDDPYSRAAPAASRPLVAPGAFGGEAGLPPATVRLGVPDPAALEFADPALRECFVAAVARARRLVAGCVPIDPAPFLAAGQLLYEGPWVAERLAHLGSFLRANPGAVLPVTRDVLVRGWRYDAVDVFRAQHRLQELRATADRLWADFDALLLPTVPATYTVEEVDAEPVECNLRLGRYTQFANLLDLAAVTVPNGLTPDGRPASISLLGPAFSDPTLARLGSALAGPSGLDGTARPAAPSDLTAAPATG